MIHKLRKLVPSICLFAATAGLARGEIIHRWSFDEAAGTALNDAVGSADGTIVVQGGPGHALGSGLLRLDGGDPSTSDFAVFPSGILGGLTDFTVEIWASPHSVQRWARVFDFGSGTSVSNSFYMSFSVSGDPNRQRVAYVPADGQLPTPYNQEYHYVVRWDDDGAADGRGRLEWFRDGVFVSGADTGTNTIAIADDTVLWLGRPQPGNPGNSQTADASWNEMRIYAEALSRRSILANLAAGPDDAMGIAPMAVDDSLSLHPGGVALLHVLGNDSGETISPGSLEIVSPPAAGNAFIDGKGRVSYTHTGGSPGADSFSYRVKNIFGLVSNTATVHVTVSNSVRLENTTIRMPPTAPAVGYGTVDAFPGLAFTLPVCLRTPPGESSRLFVVEVSGKIHVIPDVNAETPSKLLFLDLAAEVNSRPAETLATGGEQGLLGLAFHPAYATNGEFFVFYTVFINGQRHDRLSRFLVSAGNPAAADPSSEQVFIEQLDDDQIHNAGDLHFGPADHYLYVSLGDEGGGGIGANVQRIDGDFFSAIMRIDVDRLPASLEPNPHPAVVTDGMGNAYYGIPPDNPWVGATTFNGAPADPLTLREEFWAVGFRNPWRMSFDPLTGALIAGDVGNGHWEEVNVILPGKNYEWNFREGTREWSVPPPGFAGEPPLYAYPHFISGAPWAARAIIGGVVYAGTRFPDLHGAYIFCDYVSGDIYSLEDEPGGPVVERIAGDSAITALGYDPSNGDILFCDQNEGRIKRLTFVTEDEEFPGTLSATGCFADVPSLTLNPGFLAYAPNLSFWSDDADKSRWFTVPALPDTIGFSREENWDFPEGAAWVKHFDLDTTAGTKRMETRVLVKTASGNYGVSYRWNDAESEAFLVDDAGVDIAYEVDEGGGPEERFWRIPSRAECLSCHTTVGGHALSFNTRQLNRTGMIGGTAQNQIKTLNDAGYFASTVTEMHTLPFHAAPGDASASLEHRVRSYLAVNCVQCHQPGGASPGSWDARASLATVDTGMIDGEPSDNGGDPLNKIIVPGDPGHSVLLKRISASGGFGRMPNLGSNVLDDDAIALVTDWINAIGPGSLRFFADWRVHHFGSAVSAAGEREADPNGDGEDNDFEFLTNQDPLAIDQQWNAAVTTPGGNIRFDFERIPNRRMQVSVSNDLEHWSLWDVPGNEASFGATAGAGTIEGLFEWGGAAEVYFRMEISER